LGVNIRSTPDTTTADNIIHRTSGLILMKRCDTQVYPDQNPAGEGVFIKVALTDQIAGYAGYFNNNPVFTTGIFMGVTVLATLAASENPKVPKCRS
jgi:hypothetical protein